MATFRAKTLAHAKKIAEQMNKSEKLFAKHHNQPTYQKVLIGSGKSKGKEVGGDNTYTFKVKTVKGD